MLKTIRLKEHNVMAMWLSFERLEMKEHLHFQSFKRKSKFSMLKTIRLKEHNVMAMWLSLTGSYQVAQRSTQP